MSDEAGWVLDYEAGQLAKTMARLGVSAERRRSPLPDVPAFFTSRTAALAFVPKAARAGVAVTFPYFHGYPGEGDAGFDETFARFRQSHPQVARVQVTHGRMRDLLLETGIAAEKLHTIRIGIDTQAFTCVDDTERRAARRALGVPEHAVVLGSFQKDGEGWEQGDQPKIVKGPDVFVRVCQALKAQVPELFVLLAGPARGFVRRGLTEAGVAHMHVQPDDPLAVARLYHALDVYVVASRQEGGPKAVLESMASGVPIVSTRVGQAPDVITHGVTGFLADVEDVEALVDGVVRTLASPWRERALPSARQVAEHNDYVTQTRLWRAFFDGLLVMRDDTVSGTVSRCN